MFVAKLIERSVNFLLRYSVVHFQKKKNVVSSTEGPFSVRKFIIAPFVS